MLKKTFSSLTEFNGIMRQGLIKVQEATAQRILQQLFQFIYEDVYYCGYNALGYSNNEFYERTYDLVAVWDVDKVGARNRGANGNNQQVYASIAPIHEENFTHDPDLFQHSSYLDGDLDIDGLVSIINDGLSGENSLFGDIMRRPFWDDFLQWSHDNYQRIFEEEYEKVFKQKISINGGIGVTQFGNKNQRSDISSTLVKYNTNND